MNLRLAEVRRAAFLAVGLGLATTAFVGCGVEAYEARMEQRKKGLELEGKFNLLERKPFSVVDPAKAPDVDVTLRRPLLFGPKVLNEQSGDPNQPSKPIPKDRVQPPFLEIPGFQLTFEELRRAGDNGMRPISFYVGVQPIESESLDKLAADLKKAFPEADTSWKTERLLKPDGSMIEWKSIAVSGLMGFYTPGFNAAESLPGRFAILVRDEAGHQVFLAARGPESAPETSQAVEALKMAAGTVGVVRRTAAK